MEDTSSAPNTVAPVDRPVRYAGFQIRLLASLVDSLLALPVMLTLGFIFYGTAYFSLEYLSGMQHNRSATETTLQYLIPVVLIVSFWIAKQATPGKMLFKLKIVSARDGQMAHPTQLILRYLGYYVSLFAFGLGFIWIAIDEKNRGFHDLIAGTVVIRT